MTVKNVGGTLLLYVTHNLYEYHAMPVTKVMLISLNICAVRAEMMQSADKCRPHTVFGTFKLPIAFARRRWHAATSDVDRVRTAASGRSDPRLVCGLRSSFADRGKKVSEPTTRMLQVEIPATLDPVIEKFVAHFAHTLANDLHAADLNLSHHDVVLELEAEARA